MQTELWALDLSSCADAKERVEAEAAYIAGKIAAMLREQVLVEEGGEIRPCRASDFCILLRSPKGRAEVYRDALLRAGIGAGCDLSGGFFQSKEIQTILSPVSYTHLKRGEKRLPSPIWTLSIPISVLLILPNCSRN